MWTLICGYAPTWCKVWGIRKSDSPLDFHHSQSLFGVTTETGVEESEWISSEDGQEYTIAQLFVTVKSEILHATSKWKKTKSKLTSGKIFFIQT